MFPGPPTVLTSAGALAVVILLIWLIGRGARFAGWVPRRTDGGALSVRDAITLEAGRRLHLIRCNGREVLLLTGKGPDVVVGWIDAEYSGLTGHCSNKMPRSVIRRDKRQRRVVWLSLALMCVPMVALHAQSISVDLGMVGQPGAAGRIIQLAALVTVLALAPSLLAMVTAFTRIIIVLSLLRSALATQGTPPNVVLIGLALFLTFFVMQPTLDQAWTQGVAPMAAGQLGEIEGIRRAIEPFHHFLITNLRPADLRFFLELAHLPAVSLPDQAPWRAVVPAFLVGELRRAFEMGFLLFLPFLVIDMVVASVLMSLGMMMLPPSVVSLPFKLIFFVLVDGWRLVAGSLVQSFAGQ